ncbi:MAG: hypothetical protein WC505_02585 [Patescibacteria group bacterium]
MIKPALFVLAATLLVLFQVSFLHEFEPLRYSLNFILICVVLVTTLINYKTGFIFAFSAGLVLDFFSSFEYGVITFALVVPVLLIFILFRKLLARKSAYSLLGVIVVSTLAYHAILFTTTKIITLVDENGLSFSLNWQYVSFVGTQIVVHSLVTIGFFYFIRLLGNKFRSVFLISDRV